MKACLIVIGDELLNGKIADQNASWLAKALAMTAIELEWVRFVKDDRAQVLLALAAAKADGQITLTTGGIGPTKDDQTKSILAEFLGLSIRESQKAREVVQDNYQRFERPWNEKNGYHLLPVGVEPVNNPKGLAPGLFYFNENQQQAIMCAPGVPREFQAMLESEFLPLIAEKMSGALPLYRHFNVRTFGIPEEKIFFELCPELWEELSAFGQVSSLPQVMGIDIGIKMKCDGQEEERCQKLRSVFENSPLAPYIWQYGQLSLPQFVLARAREQGVSLSCAESCTGGLVATRITDVPGCSDVFLGGVVSYSNALKAKLLGVLESTLELHGAVSEQCALEMARGVRKLTASDYSISVTGIAGPGGGSLQKPVGTVAIGWSSGKSEGSQIYHFAGDRPKLKERFSEKALFKLVQLFSETT